MFDFSIYAYNLIKILKDLENNGFPRPPLKRPPICDFQQNQLCLILIIFNTYNPNKILIKYL